jgi:ABC-type nitrate/sulfonate/bicarbonate transport system substrate-binding protein
VQKGIGKLLSAEAMVPTYMWSPFPFASFNLTRDFVEKDPETARHIVKSLDEAIDFIQANQQEAKRIMATFLPDVQKPFVEHYPDALFVKSQQFPVQDLLKVEEAYQNQGIIKGHLDLSTSLYK